MTTSTPRTRRPRRAAARAVPAALTGLLTSVALAACGAPGGSSAGSGSTTSASQEISAPVTAADVAKAGKTTLTLWADEAEQPLLDEVIPAFEKQYPGVTVKPTYKSFDDLVATVVNAASSDSPPDLFQGNIGYAVDGALVKAHLVRPLDDVSTAYGWDADAGASTLGPARWNAAGTKFGDGTLYGMSVISEVQGIYYDQAKLAKLGLQPPTSLDELAADLPKAQAAGEQPIMLGNSDQYAATHVLSDLAAADGDVQQIKDWVDGKESATFVTDGNRKAAQTMADWAKAGYFGAGYDGISNEDAIARFASGTGVFFVGGSWNGASLKDGFGVAALPTGGAGATASPWHISASSEHAKAAAAFLAMLRTPAVAQQIVDTGRLPVLADAVKGSTPLEQQTIDALKATIAAGTQVGYYDWTTTDMLDVMGGGLQEVMAGKTPVDTFLKTVQDDWAKAQSKR